MNEVKVVIVEDEPIIAADLANQLRKVHIEVLEIFDDGLSVLDYLKSAEPDVILMDVQLYGDLDGVDTANRISMLHNIPIIFLTANTDSRTFNRARLSTPCAFLSKPFRINDVMHAITLAIESKQDNIDEDEFLTDRIFIRNKESLEKVLFSHILYLKADGAYTKLFTGEKQYIVSQTLKKVEEKITDKNIFRVHRSYVVNINKIDKITEGYVHIGTSKVPVSRSHREHLLELLGTM